MEDTFNKKILLDNIALLLKKSNMKIGELETAAGVSLGYISRISKDEKAKPGIDFILNTASALNVSVDTLVKVDMTVLTPTERYLVSFLEKLIQDTRADKLDWNRETQDFLNCQQEADQYGFTDHPLFRYETFTEDIDYPQEVSRVIFVSNSYDVNTWIAGDCYNLRLKNGTYLYLMNISKRVHNANDPDAYAKEVWIAPSRFDRQYLCSTNNAAIIASLVETLYTTIKESLRHPRVNKNVRYAIDAFMNDDLEDDEDYSDPAVG